MKNKIRKFAIVRKGLGGRIKKIRGYQTLEEFAISVDMSPRSIWRYENGEGSPKPSTLRNIADKRGINHQWLFEGIGEPYIKMVAAGSIDEHTRGADEEGDEDLPLTYWQDESIFDKWMREEEAPLLYHLTRAEIRMLKKFPIRGVAEDYEEHYSMIYRECLRLHRRIEIENRKRAAKAVAVPVKKAVSK